MLGMFWDEFNFGRFRCHDFESSAAVSTIKTLDHSINYQRNFAKVDLAAQVLTT